ncbi:hypothetical protein [Vibrio sp. Vb1980]|uniref:hypothetical protein n=1 Tax=Vibrio sp. Vb1980 TaxID=3074646 RepID=UPI0029647C4A|nr:hypothetical protein [Vibrio sp. Vb1980]MDW1976707.1 hypothetical protein [Vibrio sp. Vb1980]
MGDSKDSEVKRYEREKSTDRQRDMADKRRESGWKGYRLQFSKSDYAKIQKLGKKLKYDIPDVKASLIDISSIVSHSLTVACIHEGLSDKDLPKTSQQRLYRQRLKEVIRHRIKKEIRCRKLQKDADETEILELVAEFMNNSGYTLPVVSHKTKMKVPEEQRDSWCVAWIKALVTKQR